MVGHRAIETATTSTGVAIDDDQDAESLDDDPCGDGDGDQAHRDDAPKASRRWRSPVRVGALVGTVIIVALAGLVGWLGVRAHQAHQAAAQRELFLQVGRQGAINLTTIDFAQADSDVARILNSATGTFYDDFSQRSQPFIDVVKQAHSKSVGTVTEAGVESESGDQAQVLVAVSVKTSIAGAPEQNPRGWRMRIDVQKVGDQVKVSNVEFVP